VLLGRDWAEAQAQQGSGNGRGQEAAEGAAWRDRARRLLQRIR
jgi:hypothetical protein